MTQIFTSVPRPAESIPNEGITDGLLEEEKRFYYSIKEELNGIAKSPQRETIESILQYSRSF